MPHSASLVGALIPGSERFTNCVFEGVRHTTASRPSKSNGKETWHSRGNHLLFTQCWELRLAHPTYSLSIILTNGDTDQIEVGGHVNKASSEVYWTLSINGGKPAKLEQVRRLLQECLETCVDPEGTSLFDQVQQSDTPVQIPSENAWQLARKLNALLQTWPPSQF